MVTVNGASFSKDFAERAKCSAGRDGIGCIGDDQHRRLIAATDRAFKIGRNFDGEQHSARSEQLIDLGFAMRQLCNLEEFCVLKRGQN